MRVVAIGRPGTATVASKVFLKAGSRHDGDRHGISHCLEHALFRGTATRSSRELYGAIEVQNGFMKISSAGLTRLIQPMLNQFRLKILKLDFVRL
jgi:predicted Zn-dependent peptidase